MAGYADTKKLIEDTLVGRPAGTMIYPEGHQAIDMSLLDYIHSVELLGASELQGIATTSTVPVQPDNAKVSYIATVPAGQTYVFTNFHDQNGNSISITTGANTVSLLTFLWNGEYWQVQNNQIQLMLNITAGFLYAGIAIPSTNPGSPDEPVFYIAAQAGTYTNFGGIVVNDGEAAILKYVNSSWVKEVSGLATREEVSRLGQQLQQSIYTGFAIVQNRGSVDYDYSNLLQKDNFIFQGDGIVYTSTVSSIWQGLLYKILNPIKGKTIRIEAMRSGGYGNKYIRTSYYDSIGGTEKGKLFYSGNFAELVVPDDAVEIDVLLSVAWDSTGGTGGQSFPSGSQCTFNDVAIYYKERLIINNLVSDSIKDALSAAQGKKLKSLIDRMSIMVAKSDIVLDVSNWVIKLPANTIIRYDSMKSSYNVGDSELSINALPNAEWDIILFDRTAQSFSCVVWDTDITALDEKYTVCNIIRQVSGNIVFCLYGQAHTINGGNKLTSFSQVVEAFANEDVKINSVNDKIEASYIIVNNLGTVVANYSNLTQKDNYLFQGDGIVYTATSNNKWQGIFYKFKNPIKGKTIRVEATRVDGIGSKFIRLSWYDSNGVEQLKQFFTGNTAEYVVPDGAVEFDVLLAAAWDGDTYTSGSQCTFNDVNIYYKTDDAVSKEDFENLVSGNGEYQYYGVNKVNIAFNTYKMAMAILMTRTYNQTPVSYPANYRNIQSIAIFNDIMFGFLQGRAAYIFDFSTKTDLGYMELPFSSHGNNAQFTDVYFDENDTFPLLLLSRCDNSGKVSVLRITVSSGVYSCTLVKDIIIDIPAVKSYGFSACADLNRRKLIMSYNLNGDWQVTTNNPAVLQEFELPDLSVQQDVTYTNEDGKMLAINPMYIVQGITYDNGLIYQAAQLRGNNYVERYGIGNIACVIVFNAANGEIQNIIPTNSEEPEGVAIYKNKLYVQAANQSGTGDDTVFWLHEYVF